ncbi:unnamed protein product [Miscanthus lutarioriparius]|uniref:Uncharacterized protein n=1 Tax=Miscanthus lutarioriparius TaxID=422564 RepID=A0A811MTW3_9POAL|nr:unnamed protein product [Miscanthus lutarioriparius]
MAARRSMTSPIRACFRMVASCVAGSRTHSSMARLWLPLSSATMRRTRSWLNTARYSWLIAARCARMLITLRAVAPEPLERLVEVDRVLPWPRWHQRHPRMLAGTTERSLFLASPSQRPSFDFVLACVVNRGWLAPLTHTITMGFWSFWQSSVATVTMVCCKCILVQLCGYAQPTETASPMPGIVGWLYKLEVSDLSLPAAIVKRVREKNIG